jgi:serine/threonine protein kinase
LVKNAEEGQKPWSDERVAFYAAQLILGINYMHENEVMHRDIKSENILLDSHGNV